MPAPLRSQFQNNVQEGKDDMIIHQTSYSYAVIRIVSFVWAATISLDHVRISRVRFNRKEYKLVKNIKGRSLSSLKNLFILD